jgi:hypothetical protein
MKYVEGVGWQAILIEHNSGRCELQTIQDKAPLIEAERNKKYADIRESARQNRGENRQARRWTAIQKSCASDNQYSLGMVGKKGK